MDTEIGNTADMLFIEVLKIIDEQLTAVLDCGEGDWEDNLIPYDARTIAEETRSMMIYSLLTGCCKRLAEDRVHAIREGQSIVDYMKALANGTKNKMTIKASLNTELKRAKEAGFNFNMLANFWLCKCGVAPLFPLDNFIF